MSDKRMVAICIGVAGSVPTKYLAGAINGARDFEQWASRQGYETALIVDEPDAVTIGVLRARIESLLRSSPDPIHRIIVYFAGHGLIREIEEGLWLLSDWRDELRAVAVEILKRRLTMYGARQVSIISDACRSLPADIAQADLVPDPVLGAGPKPVDMTVAFDRFIAAQDGAEAFMIPGADPADDRCLFSGVLIEGLWGIAGLHAQPFARLEPDKITSRSLAAYLQAEATARAKDYGLTLVPSVSPTFPDGDDYYFSKDPNTTLPKFAPWPPVKKTPESKLEYDVHIALEGKSVVQFDWTSSVDISSGTSREVEQPPSAYQGVLDELRAAPGIYTGLSVQSRQTTRLWLSSGAVSRPVGSSRTWSVSGRGGAELQDCAPALVEFSDGLFAAIVVLPRLFASLSRDDYGATRIVYCNLQDSAAILAPTEAALSALDRGALRTDEATDLAAELRRWKHADPVLGVISAYLYDAIGDVESIRRLAGFYVQYGQAIPYDIALLGGLRGEGTDSGFVVEIPEVEERRPRTDLEKGLSWTYSAMPACKGMVAGFWPWLRQGWTFLDNPTDFGSPLILPGLVELRSSLMKSRFTTLETDAATELARLCGLRPR